MTGARHTFTRPKAGRIIVVIRFESERRKPVIFKASNARALVARLKRALLKETKAPFPWEEWDDFLCEQRVKGVSSREIAKELSRLSKKEVTRSAVIGRASRLREKGVTMPHG